ALRTFTVNPARAEGGFGVSGRAQLDLLRADLLRYFNLRGIGIDEKTREDVSIANPIYRRLDDARVCFGVESAFSRDLIRPFGNERNGIRSCLQRDVEHLVGRGHFEIEVGRDGVAQES